MLLYIESENVSDILNFSSDLKKTQSLIYQGYVRYGKSCISLVSKSTIAYSGVS